MLQICPLIPFSVAAKEDKRAKMMCALNHKCQVCIDGPEMNYILTITCGCNFYFWCFERFDCDTLSECAALTKRIKWQFLFKVRDFSFQLPEVSGMLNMSGTKVMWSSIQVLKYWSVKWKLLWERVTHFADAFTTKLLIGHLLHFDKAGQYYRVTLCNLDTIMVTTNQYEQTTTSITWWSKRR